MVKYHINVPPKFEKKAKFGGTFKETIYPCKKGKSMDRIIGRDAELAKLARYDQSGKAEFIALYGRLRVGRHHLYATTLRISLTSLPAVYWKETKKTKRTPSFLP